MEDDSSTTISEGWIKVPKGTVSPDYDEAGNLDEDDRWDYEWDSVNRLRKMTPTPAAVTGGFPNRTLEFVYDWQGRRIAKKVTEGSTVTHRRYLYEGWNVVAEWGFTGSTGLVDPQTYLWGLDLAGQMSGDIDWLQAAGGAGGLLAVEVLIPGTNTSLGALYAAYDGNGNILAWIGGDGLRKRTREYDAFGNVVLETTDPSGPLAVGQGTSVAYGFSTKPEDEETGLLYYGYRFYNPVFGRWASRDPIGEIGGLNINGFNGNDGINRLDKLGLDYHHWFIQAGERDVNGNAPGQYMVWSNFPLLKDMCFDIDDYTTWMEGQIGGGWSGTPHQFLHGKIVSYSAVYLDVLKSSKDSCQFLISMKILMEACHILLRER